MQDIEVQEYSAIVSSVFDVCCAGWLALVDDFQVAALYSMEMALGIAPYLCYPYTNTMQKLSRLHTLNDWSGWVMVMLLEYCQFNIFFMFIGLF